MNLKELSTRLGLSQTTVSRALNGYPEVNEQTRARVRAVAHEVGYRPNARARGLAIGRANTIGHVIPISAQHEMVNPVFGDFLAGAGSAYALENYDLQLSLVHDGEEEAAYRKLATNGSVDGVIVHGPRMEDARIDLLTELGMPFVVHGRASNIDTPYTWLDIDNTRAFHRATQLLIELGHTKIGLVNGFEFMDFAHRRRTGYLNALDQAGLSTGPDYMASAEMSEVNGYQAVRAMLALPKRPTAVLLSSVISAIGARRAVDEAGLRMGKDISLVCHDDDLAYLRNGQDVPIFTATRSSVRDAGAMLGAMLIARIKNPDLGPEQKLLEAELILGQSTGPCPT